VDRQPTSSKVARVWENRSRRDETASDATVVGTVPIDQVNIARPVGDTGNPYNTYA
jgi:hypothetical protein